MNKLMVYSHDTFGLGNVRRMLSICEHLIDAISDASILLVTGSPVIQSFRLPRRLDYVKLPCLSRDGKDQYSAKFLGTEIEETIRLRSRLIQSAASSFRPDVVLVDKKPYGVKNELRPAMASLRSQVTPPGRALILRDILDSPEETVASWERQGNYAAVAEAYDLVLVLGTPEVFEVREEYRMPADVARRVRYCGYTKRRPGRRSRIEVRQSLGVSEQSKMVLVTPGGGEDGYHLLSNYVASLPLLPGVFSYIVHGPEIRPADRQRLQEQVSHQPNVRLAEFTDDMMACMDAADVVVSMAGYNTVCELATLHKRAVLVPRAKPVAEQWIRAARLQQLGLFRMVEPEGLTPGALADAVRAELGPVARQQPRYELDMGGLDRVSHWVQMLLQKRRPAPGTIASFVTATV